MAFEYNKKIVKNVSQFRGRGDEKKSSNLQKLGFKHIKRKM